MGAAVQNIEKTTKHRKVLETYQSGETVSQCFDDTYDQDACEVCHYQSVNQIIYVCNVRDCATLEGDVRSVCRKTCVLDCLEYASWHVHFALWALVWATHGLPVVRAPVYRGCPCRDPLGCPPMPRQDGIGSRAPSLCGCAVLVVVDL